MNIFLTKPLEICIYTKIQGSFNPKTSRFLQDHINYMRQTPKNKNTTTGLLIIPQHIN